MHKQDRVPRSGQLIALDYPLGVGDKVRLGIMNGEGLTLVIGTWMIVACFQEFYSLLLCSLL